MISKKNNVRPRENHMCEPFRILFRLGQQRCKFYEEAHGRMEAEHALETRILPTQPQLSVECTDDLQLRSRAWECI
jgi:hypothetical protein